MAYKNPANPRYLSGVSRILFADQGIDGANTRHGIGFMLMATPPLRAKRCFSTVFDVALRVLIT